MATRTSIRITQTCAEDPREAAEQLYAGLARPDTALVIFFCSGKYDRDALAEAMGRLFAGVQVVGCTTAGEIGPVGCRDRSIAGASFSRDVCSAVTGHIEHLRDFDIAGGLDFAQDLLRRLKTTDPRTGSRTTLAFLLVDGLSVREELLAHTLQTALGEIPVVGGSAGDGLSFGRTHVYADGRFTTDSAVLTLITTPLSFQVFETQHFVPTDERMVVTEADSARRIVKEINGLPAAQEYARILDVAVSDLGPVHFAASPVVVLIDGANYVRSIQKANPDGTLTFFCAIEEGVVLRVATGVDLVADLERAFSQVRETIGPPQLVLACDCILRRLEIAEGGLGERVSAVFHNNNAVGFNTYGEQFCGVHVNQTLTGVAFGARPTAADDA